MDSFYTHKHISIVALALLVSACAVRPVSPEPEPQTFHERMTFIDGHVIVDVSSAAGIAQSQKYAGRLKRAALASTDERLNNVSVRIDEMTRRNVEAKLAVQEGR